jgi:hypothetical protein
MIDNFSKFICTSVEIYNVLVPTVRYKLIVFHRFLLFIPDVSGGFRLSSSISLGFCKQ